MKRWRLFGTAYVAVLSIAAIAAGSASAAFPNALPTGFAYNETSGTAEFGSGITAIKSSLGKGKGASTSEKDGTFEQVFESSKDQLGSTCTGLSDKVPGSITVTGETHFRWNTAKTVVFILYLLKEVHFSCGTTLIKVKGCVAGEYASSLNTPIKTATVHFVVVTGDNVPVTVENAANTGTENCELKAEINDTAPTLSSERVTETLQGFSKGLGGVGNEIEVMTK